MYKGPPQAITFNAIACGGFKKEPRLRFFNAATARYIISLYNSLYYHIILQIILKDYVDMNFLALVKNETAFRFNFRSNRKIVDGEFRFVDRNAAALDEPSRFAF